MPAAVTAGWVADKETFSRSGKIDKKLAVDTGAMDLIGWVLIHLVWQSLLREPTGTRAASGLFFIRIEQNLEGGIIGGKKPLVTQRFLAVMAAVKTGD